MLALAAAPCCAAPGRIAVVGETAVDFGEYPAGESREAVFRIRNIGQGPLTISRVRKGCACATVKLAKKRLAPGEETSIGIRVRPYSIFGPYRKTAYVDTSDPRAPHTRLVYGGNARPLIAVTPRQFVYAGRLPLHREITHTFTLTPDREGVAFGKPAVRASLPVQSSLEPFRTGTTNAFRFSVSFTPTNNGPLQVAVDLPVANPTNHPPIKLGLAGSLGCELVAVPAKLSFAGSETTQQRLVRLRLIGPVPQALEATRLRITAADGVSPRFTATSQENTVGMALTFEPRFLRTVGADNGRELVIRYPGAAPARVQCVMAR